MGRKIGIPLREAGAIVHLHDDHFRPDAEDALWLTQVGAKGWIVLTKDKMIRKRTIEKNALMSANVKAFFFMSGNIPFAEIAEAFAKALPAISDFVARNDPPFIAGIYKDASVKMLLPA